MTQLLEATSYTGAILRTFTPTQLHLLVRAFDVVAEQRLYVACPAPSSASCSSLHPRLEMAPCGTLLRRGLAVLKTQYLKKKAVLRAERTKLSNMRQIIRQRVSAKDEREADRWSSLSSGSSLLGDSTDECVENNESGKDSAAKPKGPTQPLPTVFKSGPVKPKGPGPPPVEDAKAHSAKPKGLAPPPPAARAAAVQDPSAPNHKAYPNKDGVLSPGFPAREQLRRGIARLSKGHRKPVCEWARVGA